MVYNTLCKDERTRRNIYLLLLENIGVERSPPFFRTMYPNRNHVTTHPECGLVVIKSIIIDCLKL